jgi:hypothetical protein
MAEVISSKSRFDLPRVETHQETPRSAQPAGFLLSDQGSSFNVTASAKDNITRPNTMAAEAFRVGLSNPSDAIGNDAVVPDVDRHD